MGPGCTCWTPGDGRRGAAQYVGITAGCGPTACLALGGEDAPRKEARQGDGQKMHWSSGLCVCPRAVSHLSPDLRLSIALGAPTSLSVNCTNKVTVMTMRNLCLY